MPITCHCSSPYHSNDYSLLNVRIHMNSNNNLLLIIITYEHGIAGLNITADLHRCQLFNVSTPNYMHVRLLVWQHACVSNCSCFNLYICQLAWLTTCLCVNVHGLQPASVPTNLSTCIFVKLSCVNPHGFPPTFVSTYKIFNQLSCQPTYL